MRNDLKYQIRSREIVDLYNSIQSQNLILSPYFQRNLVWRESHRRDFIDTILRGFPFPQIFLARGQIDVERLSARQCVVDGQQRLNSIMDFISGRLEVDGRTFSDLTIREKESFLKYEVAVIDFDLDESDERLKEIFKRLNRTYYSLSAIERIASEYSASEFLLTARLLNGDFSKLKITSIDDVSDIDFVAEFDTLSQAREFSIDPGIEEDSWRWINERSDTKYGRLISDAGIFSSYEFSRKIPLMHTLNVMCTHIAGYYNRNDKVRDLLDQYNSSFPEKDKVYNDLEFAADFITKMDLPKQSIWWQKANFFTLACEVSSFAPATNLSPTSVAKNLSSFAANLPHNYTLAAREAVGRVQQRRLRAKYVRAAILEKPLN